MRKGIEADMKARIAAVESNFDNDRDLALAKIENIKEQAQAESDRLDMEKTAEFTFAMYRSYIDAGFTEEQAWTLVQIMVTNSTKQKVSIF